VDNITINFKNGPGSKLNETARTSFNVDPSTNTRMTNMCEFRIRGLAFGLE